jgi:hypothetical protein
MWYEITRHDAAGCIVEYVVCCGVVFIRCMHVSQTCSPRTTPCYGQAVDADQVRCTGRSVGIIPALLALKLFATSSTAYRAFIVRGISG